MTDSETNWNLQECGLQHTETCQLTPMQKDRKVYHFHSNFPILQCFCQLSVAQLHAVFMVTRCQLIIYKFSPTCRLLQHCLWQILNYWCLVVVVSSANLIYHVMTLFLQKHCVLVCCGTTVDKSAQISGADFVCVHNVTRSYFSSLLFHPVQFYVQLCWMMLFLAMGEIFSQT